jgi:hypothetical protein
MPVRAVLFSLCVALLFTVACREPLVPNADLNQAPETWIVAAPQDTITLRDPSTGPVQTPIGTIASKFRIFWAGADRDGQVVGFYWAVVETVPIPPPGLRLPPLPGPKPQDYHFTTKTDSTFIFRVSEDSPDRQHAFFVYSVDDGGKPDPTPARVIFNALDRFPPLPILDCGELGQPLPFTYMRAIGPIYTQVPGGLFQRDTTVFICDSLVASRAPRDTIPQRARIDIKWRGEPTIAGTYITGFRYKLDEPEFNAVDSSVTTASYNTGVAGDVVRPGTKIFTLRAVDQAGGMREISRYFFLNFSPDSWFSGPDPNQPFYAVEKSQSPLQGLDRFYDVTNWHALPQFTGSLLSCDSLTTWPAERPARKTFFEIYKNRIYVRSEGDTINMNSWVLMHGGGRDLDSPYLVKVTDYDRTQDTLICGESKTLRPGPPNGSPIGYHVYFPNRLNLVGAQDPVSAPAQSGVLPIFDSADVLNKPRIGGYEGFRRAGRVYAVIRADDGNGYDARITSRPDRIIDRIDNNTASAEDKALADALILTFYVDRAPYLLVEDAAFVPKSGQTFATRRLDLNLMGNDLDPLDPDTAPVTPGGPSTNTLLRWTVQVKGVDATGDTVVVETVPKESFAPNISITVPSTIVGTQVLVLVELCDCSRCEIVPGQGRCVNYVFPVNIPPPTNAAAGESVTVGPGPTH